MPAFQTMPRTRGPVRDVGQCGDRYNDRFKTAMQSNHDRTSRTNAHGNASNKPNTMKNPGFVERRKRVRTNGVQRLNSPVQRGNSQVYFENELLPIAHSEAIGQPPMAISPRAYQLLQSAHGNEGQGQTHRALPSRNSCQRHTQTPPAPRLVRLEKLASCLLSQLARHGSPTVCTS